MKRLLPALLIGLAMVSFASAQVVHISGTVSNRKPGEQNYVVRAYNQYNHDTTVTGGLVDNETGHYDLTVMQGSYVSYLKCTNAYDPKEKEGVRNMGYTVDENLTGKDIIMGKTITEM